MWGRKAQRSKKGSQAQDWVFPHAAAHSNGRRVASAKIEHTFETDEVLCESEGSVQFDRRNAFLCDDGSGEL